MNNTNLPAANTMDVDVRGPSERLGHQQIPAGHVGIRLGFGAEFVDGSRAESLTLVKPAPEMLAFLDRLRTAVSELPGTETGTVNPADGGR